ncbi:hypothetical protein ACJX0J_033931, partial [Zea mays]
VGMDYWHELFTVVDLAHYVTVANTIPVDGRFERFAQQAFDGNLHFVIEIDLFPVEMCLHRSVFWDLHTFYGWIYEETSKKALVLIQLKYFSNVELHKQHIFL